MELPRREPGFVYIFHPELKQPAAVHPDALGAHYARGWRLLAGDDIPAEPAPGVPPPISLAEAEEIAASVETPAGASVETSAADKPAEQQPGPRRGRRASTDGPEE